MTARIRELSEVADLRALADFFALVWGRPGEVAIDSDVLKALALSGNYVAGAYEGERLIGGLVGWLGGPPATNLHLHSHILGVLPGSETRGLGFDLKQHQRRWCLARGVKVMEWTTDPLIRRNVYFNLTKLGARAPRYLVDVYGTMRDSINAGEESDRLLIVWDLDSPATEAAAAGKPVELDVDSLRATGASVVLSEGEAGEAVAGPVGGTALLLQLPQDVVELRRRHPALAREWRMSLRRIMRDALDAGYVIKGATRSGWYVLEEEPH